MQLQKRPNLFDQPDELRWRPKPSRPSRLREEKQRTNPYVSTKSDTPSSLGRLSWLVEKIRVLFAF